MSREQLLSTDEECQSCCYSPLNDEQTSNVLFETESREEVLARIMPYAWALMFYNFCVLFGGTLLYLMFVFNQTVCPESGKDLPNVDFRLTGFFVPILAASAYLEIRVSQRIFPCLRKFEKSWTFLRVPVTPLLWLMIRLAKASASKFELATSAITFSRLWHAESCHDNGIEDLWERGIRGNNPPHLRSIGLIAFAASWLPVLYTIIAALPGPACGHDWLPGDQSRNIPAIKPMSLHDLMCKYVKTPKSDATGGFFSVLGPKVFVVSSVRELARVSKSYAVAEPLNELTQAIEHELLPERSETRASAAMEFFVEGLANVKLPFSYVWLNIKCILLGLDEQLSIDSSSPGPDKLLLLGIFMTVGSFFVNLMSETYVLQKRFWALYQHIDKKEDGVDVDEQQDLKRRSKRTKSGNLMYWEAEKDWQVTRNKFMAYSGFGLHIFFGVLAVCMVLYAMRTLYMVIFVCQNKVLKCVGRW